MSTSTIPTTTHITTNTTLTTITTNIVIKNTTVTSTNLPHLKATTLNAHSI